MQPIIVVKNRLHSHCTTSFLGPPSWGIETRALVRLRATHTWGIWTLLAEKVPDLLLLLLPWIVTRAVLNGFLLIYRVAAAGGKHHLEAWPSPTGWHRWWNKACSLPVLMLFSGFCFVLSFWTFYSAAAKRSRSVARRACPSRRYSLHIASLPPTPALSSTSNVANIEWLEFSGKAKYSSRRSARLSRFNLTENNVLNFLPLSSHSGPLFANCTFFFFFFPFSFLTECGRFGSESSAKEHTRLRAVSSKLRQFYYSVGSHCLDKCWFVVA